MQDSPNQIFPSSGQIFINSYSGLGDFLLLAPLIIPFIKRYPARVLVLENPIISFFVDLEIISSNLFTPVLANHRRLFSTSIEAAHDFFQEHNVALILNLRRDRFHLGSVRLKRRIRDFEALGIKAVDLSAYESDLDHPVHVHKRYAWFFQQLGFSESYSEFGWLLSLTDRFEAVVKQNCVVIYIGASTAIKQFSSRFWYVLCAHLCRLGVENLILVSGYTQKEITDSQRIYDHLIKAGFKLRLTVGFDLHALSSLVVASRLVVAVDTFIIHLAEALGTPAYGIYNATDPYVYGPRFPSSSFSVSPFYYHCKDKNEIGNCSGWDQGCDSLTCQSYLDPSTIAENIKLAL